MIQGRTFADSPGSKEPAEDRVDEVDGRGSIGAQTKRGNTTLGDKGLEEYLISIASCIVYIIFFFRIRVYMYM